MVQKNNPYMVASCTLDGAEDITIQEGCLYIDSSFTWLNRANVKNVTMASTVKEFGKKTFYYCSNLESIIIPDSLQTIPEETFEHCENLKHITLGANLNFLPYSALVGCRNIETMTFKNPNGWYFDPHYRASSAKIVELSAEVLADPVLAKDEFYSRYPLSDSDSRFDNIRLTKNPDYKFANS